MTDFDKRTDMNEEEQDFLKSYDATIYKRPSVTVDIVVFSIIDQKLKVLTIRRKFPPFRNCAALPGGFLDIDARETLEETALRELQEETGAKAPIFQLKAYGDPDRDPRLRVVTVAFYALIKGSVALKQDIKGMDDAIEAKWVDFRSIKPKAMAFDHGKILTDAREHLKERIMTSPLAFSITGKTTTWPELQKVYEAVLGRRLLAPNFRRWINRLYNIELGKVGKSKGPGRPAATIRYKGIKEIM